MSRLRVTSIAIVSTMIAVSCCLSIRRAESQVVPPGLTRETLPEFHPISPEQSVAMLRSFAAAQRPSPGLRWSVPRAAAIAATGFARWSEVGPPSREDHSLVYDSRRDRFLVTGGNAYHPAQNVWAFPADAPVSPVCLFGGDTTNAWASWSAVYDSLHDRLVAVEATYGAPTRLWQFSLSQPHGWTPIAASGDVPTINSMPGMAWDESGQQLYVVGIGADAAPHVWQADPVAETWTALAPTGTAPALDYWVANVVVFDSRRRSLVVNNERLVLDGGAWHWHDGEAPPHFSGSMTLGVAYDAAADRMIGVPYGGDALLTWRMGDAGWTTIGPLNVALGSRRHVALAIDPVRRRLLVSAGFSDGSWTASSALTAIALDPIGDWQDLGVYSGEARMWHQAVLDPAHDRMIVHGGWLTELPSATTLIRPLDGSPPIPIVPEPGPQPRRRYGFSLAYDSNRDRLLVHGGQATDGTGDYLGDLWSLDLASSPPRWEPLPDLPGAPGIRFFGSAFFDPAHDRLVLFGGLDLDGYPAGVHVLEFSPTPHWRSLGVSGAIDGSGPHDCFFDATRGRAWVDPGSHGVIRMDMDHDSVHFVAVAVAGPEAPNIHFDGFDPTTESLVGFGCDSYGYQSFTSLWMLRLGDEPLLRPEPVTGALPYERRFLEATVFDPRRSRLVMYGGYDDGHHYFDDWFALAFEQPVPALADLVGAEDASDGVHLAWHVRTPGTSVRVERSDDGTSWGLLATLVADGSGELRWTDVSVRPGSTLRYRLRFADGATSAEATVVVRALVSHLRLVPERNPTDGPLAFVVDLPREGAAELALYDLAGRRVRSTTLRSAAPGERRVTLEGAALSPGLYWSRLSVAGESVGARVVVIR